MAALLCLLFPQVARARKVRFEHSGPGRVHKLALTPCSEAETMTWHTTSSQNAAAELPCLGRIVGEWCVVVEQGPNISRSSRAIALAQCWCGTVYRVHKCSKTNRKTSQQRNRCQLTLPCSIARLEWVVCQFYIPCQVPNRERRQCSSTRYRVYDMVGHRCSHLRCIDELWHYSSGPLSTLALVLVVVFEIRVVVLVREGLVVPSLGDVAGHGH